MSNPENPENNTTQNLESEVHPDRSNIARGPLGIELPPHAEILKEVRNLIGSGDMRVPKIANLVIQDPVLTLELLKVANATFFSGDRPPITSVANAVVRLGSGAAIEALDHLAERQPLAPKNVMMQFEILRTLSQEVSVVANIISSIVARDLVELSEVSGLLSYFGHLIGCAYLGEKYVSACSAKGVASLAYKLQQDYHFDIRAIQVNYLRSKGIPQSLLIGIDREIQCKSPSQANLRFVVQSAAELVEAAHSGKWDKYSPSHTLPSKSNLRLLKITENQYATIYEAISEYFKTHTPPKQELEDGGTTTSASEVASAGKDDLTHSQKRSKLVQEVISKEADYVTRSREDLDEDSNTLSSEGKRVITLIQHLCSNCRTTQDLLSATLNLLVADAPYARAALILLSNERVSAKIHTSVGLGLENGSTIAVEDPLSPLALCLTQIKSFNAKGLEDNISPLGITSYAVSPVKVSNETPVVLYADCGIDRPLPLEARRIFRLVVGLLNHILPSLPGGLPKTPGKNI